MRVPLAVVGALLVLAGIVAAAEKEDRRAADEKLLESARVATDGPALLDFFRQRTRSHVDRDKIEAWIKRLGDEDFAERERSTRALIAVGVAAVPALKQALTDADPEVSSRAKRCLEALPVDADYDLLAAASRRLAQRNPTGTVEVLLAFLPDAADDMLQEEILTLLPSLVDERTLRHFVQAAENNAAIRRRAAALCLARSPRAAERQAVRKLLDDSDPHVRWQAAHGLVHAGDKNAVPALPLFLHEGPQALALQADELLRRIGGTHAPTLALDSADSVSRRQCRALWHDWWQASHARIDLDKLKPDAGRLGLTAICENGGDGTSRVWECAADGKPRWLFKARNPIALEILPGGRILVADSHADGQVAEHDHQGKVLWSRKALWPVSCQRLPNGNTFIATQNDLLEVTRGGRTVFSFRKPKFIFAAHKLPNGHIVYLHSAGQIVEIDPDGVQVRVLAIGGVTGWGHIDVLANGNCLVAQYSGNRVVEIDLTGKVLWECEVETPSWVSRLSTGNVLVASADARRVLELDRDGKKVWEQATQARPFCARRR